MIHIKDIITPWMKSKETFLSYFFQLEDYAFRKPFTKEDVYHHLINTVPGFEKMGMDQQGKMVVLIWKRFCENIY